MFQEQIRQLLEQPRKLLLWTFLFSVIPYFHWFGLILMTLATLRKGWREGIILCGVVILAGLVLNLFIFGAQALKLQVLWQAISIFGIWLMATTLYQTASWSKVLKTMIAIGVASVVLTHVFYPGITNYWEKTLAVLSNDPQNLPNFVSHQLSPDQIKQFAAYFAQIMTGMQISMLLFYGMLSIMIARYIQAALFNPGGLKPELYNLRLDTTSGAVLMALIALAILTKQAMLIDILPVLVLPGLFLGVSLVHFATARFTYQSWLLIGFYILLVLLFPQLLLAVTIVGYLDTLVNFRQRLLLKK